MPYGRAARRSATSATAKVMPVTFRSLCASTGAKANRAAPVRRRFARRWSPGGQPSSVPNASAEAINASRPTVKPALKLFVMNHTYKNAANAEAHEPPTVLVQLTRKRGMSEKTFAEVLEHLAERRARAIVADEGLGQYTETVAESFINANQTGVPDCL